MSHLLGTWWLGRLLRIKCVAGHTFFNLILSLRHRWCVLLLWLLVAIFAGTRLLHVVRELGRAVVLALNHLSLSLAKDVLGQSAGRIWADTSKEHIWIKLVVSHRRHATVHLTKVLVHLGLLGRTCIHLLHLLHQLVLGKELLHLWVGRHLVHLVSWVQVEAHRTTHASIKVCHAELVLEWGSARLSKVITELLVKHLLVRNSLRCCS